MKRKHWRPTVTPLYSQALEATVHAAIFGENPKPPEELPRCRKIDHGQTARNGRLYARNGAESLAEKIGEMPGRKLPKICQATRYFKTDGNGIFETISRN